MFLHFYGRITLFDSITLDKYLFIKLIFNVYLIQIVHYNYEKQIITQNVVTQTCIGNFSVQYQYNRILPLLGLRSFGQLKKNL